MLLLMLLLLVVLIVLLLLMTMVWQQVGQGNGESREAVKQRVKSTAKLIYENYFRVAQATPRGVDATLANIVTKIDTNCQKQLVR